MKKRIIIAALAIVAMVGCQKENNVEESSSSTAVKFSSGAISTRVTEDATDGSFGWEQGDKIGITATAIWGNYTTTYYSNVCYSATSTASSTDFEATGDDCISMHQGMDDDFVFNAFYPYSDSETVDIDVSDQSDLSKLIYMTASTSQYMSYFDGSDPVVFTFKNLLSKVVLNIQFEGGTEIDDNATVSVEMSNLATKATLNVTTMAVSTDASYENVALNCVVDGENSVVTATAILLPSSLGGDSDIKINIGGDIYSATYYHRDFASGKEYVHNVVISEGGVVMD